MKQLYIIRHAKSSWDFPELADHKRPLKKRGKNDANIIGQVLKNEQISPEMIVSSHANRALSTGRIIASYLSFPQENIVINESLYFEGVSGIVKVLKQTDSFINSLMIFGHNPDFTELPGYLTGESLFHLPTCGAIGLELPIDNWKDIAPCIATQTFFYTPKMFK